MTAARAQVDWFTNPTFSEALSWIDEQLSKENAALRAAGRGESQANFNHQTGVCDGIERMRLLLTNRQHKAMSQVEPDAGDEAP